MTNLTVGLQIFHDGLPVQLLYKVSRDIWRVKPLFVEGAEREETFRSSDRISLLHTQGAV